jgi:Flp pilus assembly protein TadD
MAGKHEPAIEYYKKILEIDPANASAKNSLAYIIAKTGGDLTKAHRLAKEALQSNPENPAYLDTFGFILYKMDNEKRAKQYLEKALSKDPASKDIIYHLAMVKKAFKDEIL